jgi:hypothetical protein
MFDDTSDFYCDCMIIYDLITETFKEARSGTARKKMYENGHHEKQPRGSYSITLGHTWRGYLSPTKTRKTSVIFKSLFETVYYSQNKDVFLDLKDFVKKYRPDFDFTEIQINYNWKSPKHKDTLNYGDSLIIGLGDYTGGQLIIEKYDGDEEHDINCKFLQFDGSKYTHYTKPYQGDRLSIVFYNINAKGINSNHMVKSLVYMAKPGYGGWVSFTAHLANKYNYKLYKIGNRTEKIKRSYGFDVKYQNLSIDDIKNLPNLLITAVDKNYYKYLPEIENATIVIHDPTELKEEVIDALKRFNVITIRKTVSDLLKNKYNIHNRFIHHPLYEFPLPPKQIKNKAICLSRVDFDKHTDIIIKANDKLPQDKVVEIYGACNDLYVYHKLRETNFKLYYKGKFGKDFSDLTNLLNNTKFLIDMSAIKGDGGGSQYTFLEGIYMECALVLNKKWTDNLNTPFKHGENCFIVENEDELSTLLINNPDTSQIVKNAKLLLNNHTSVLW